MARGAIIAVGVLANVVRTTWLDALEGDPVDGDYGLTGFLAEHGAEHERAFGNFAPGRFAWMLDDVCPLDSPIPCRGALGLWTLPDEIAEQIAKEHRP